MSPLTKALVLLVTILSIVLVALVVPFVAQTDNLQAQITDLETRVQVAQAASTNKESEVAELRSQLAASDSDLRRSLVAERSKNAELAQAVAALEGQVKEANSQVAKQAATLNLTSNSQKQLTSLLETSTAALREAQATNVDVKKQNAQLAQRNNDLDAQVTGLNRTVRLLNEKVVDLQEQLAGAPAAGSATSATAALSPAQEVRGAITGMERLEDITFIQLNVGANDGIANGMQFILYRDNDFVGVATVKSVDETVSVAKVETTRLAIQVGDAAVTGISF
ncbi:MAG: hypothetical protein AAGG38_00365 [Planctomycetota bacterium]